MNPVYWTLFLFFINQDRKLRPPKKRRKKPGAKRTGGGINVMGEPPSPPLLKFPIVFLVLRSSKSEGGSDKTNPRFLSGSNHWFDELFPVWFHNFLCSSISWFQHLWSVWTVLAALCLSEIMISLCFNAFSVYWQNPYSVFATFPTQTARFLIIL